MVGALAVLSVVVQLVRQSGVESWRTIWAEDGGIFYSGTPTVVHLLDPNGDYAQLVPRMLGLLGHSVALHDLPWYYAIAGAVVTTACAAAVWWFARQLVPSIVLRGVLTASVILLPTLVLEQLANGVNTIWALTFTAWWAVVYRPRSILDATAPAIVVFLAVLSQALALAYAPVVAYAAWRHRDRPTYLVAGGFAVAAVVQLVVIATATDHTGVADRNLHQLPQIFSTRVVASMLISEQHVRGAWANLGHALPVLAVVVVGAALTALFVVTCRGRGFAVVALLYAGGLYFGSLWRRGTVDETLGVVYHSVATRYSSLSIWMLLSALCILAANSRVRARAVATTTIVVWFVVTSLLGFRGSNPRSDGTTWATSLRNAAVLCTPRRAQIHVLVVPEANLYAIPVSCDELRRASRR